jgi:hypothetical protein
MSLPQAVKEISSHPGKNTVTSPTVKADLQEDVDRKARQTDSRFLFQPFTSPLDASVWRHPSI